MDNEYQLIITVHAESISEVDEWARGIVFPQSITPSEWDIKEVN